MDTRQLGAFCAVVELKSFSQAAERLGVTQPAVSLQVRSLEKRLGRKLLDRSGRRVEPTEAGLALYRGAQRMLQLEEQLIEELNEGEAGELGGTLAVGASTGPGSTVVPVLLCEFQRENAGVAVSLSISDTQRVVERVAERELELGVVGAARRHRGVIFEPLFRMERELPSPFDDAPRYRVSVGDHFWHWLYLPVAAAVERVSALIGLLQRGRIAVYLLYGFVTLIAVLMVVQR